jgi:hypothetical protein
MTSRPIAIHELEETRERLFAELPLGLDDAERQFLVSMHRLEPAWALLGVPDVETLPAIKWKLKNLEILKSTSPQKFNAMLEALEHRLGFN